MKTILEEILNLNNHEIESISNNHELSMNSRIVKLFHSNENEYIQSELDPKDTSTYQTFIDTVVARAEWEWSHWWKKGQLKENHQEAIPLLTDMWMTSSPGRSRSYAETLAKNRKKPWSAAFISFIMQRAGAGSYFLYADMHWDYIKAAKIAADKENTNELYWLRDVKNRKPLVGDIICYSRPTDIFPRVLTFENAGKNIRSSAHCDIVVKVNEKSIDVIGGNKGDKSNQSVAKESLSLDNNGLIDKSYFKRLFGIMSVWP